MGAEPTDTENQLYFFHLVVCPREEDNFLFISMSITLTSLYYLGTETYLRHSFSASTIPNYPDWRGNLYFKKKHFKLVALLY